MKLIKYLNQTNMSLAKFAEELDYSADTVRKWTTTHIPGRTAMLRIYHYTEGKVQPNDFYLDRKEH